MTEQAPSSAPAEDGGPDPLDTTWTRLRERWQDDPAHGQYLALAAQLSRLGEAVKRYRGVAEDETEPDDHRAIARKKMESAALLAMQMLEATRTPKADVGRLRPFVIAAAVLMVMFGGVLLWFAMR